MTIGYVTIAEADAYIQARYVSDDPLLLGWEALNDANKSVYLQRSIDALETLPFRGKKTLETQMYAFPRYPSSTVPEAIKFAQIENALKMSDTSADADAELYATMRLQGVKSYSIGNLSETLGLGGAGANSRVTSERALNWLTPFLSGGYRIG